MTRHKHKQPPKWLKFERVAHPSKGKYGRRLIAVGTFKGLRRKYTLHATKGFRSEPAAIQ